MLDPPVASSHSRQSEWQRRHSPSDYIPRELVSSLSLDATRTGTIHPTTCITGTTINNICLLIASSGPMRDLISLSQLPVNINTSSHAQNSITNLAAATYQPWYTRACAPIQQLVLNTRAPEGWDRTLWHADLPILAARSSQAVEFWKLHHENQWRLHETPLGAVHCPSGGGAGGTNFADVAWCRQMTQRCAILRSDGCLLDVSLDLKRATSTHRSTRGVVNGGSFGVGGPEFHAPVGWAPGSELLYDLPFLNTGATLHTGNMNTTAMGNNINGNSSVGAAAGGAEGAGGGVVNESRAPNAPPPSGQAPLKSTDANTTTKSTNPTVPMPPLLPSSSITHNPVLHCTFTSSHPRHVVVSLHTRLGSVDLRGAAYRGNLDLIYNCTPGQWINALATPPPGVSHDFYLAASTLTEILLFDLRRPQMVVARWEHGMDVNKNLGATSSSSSFFKGKESVAAMRAVPPDTLQWLPTNQLNKDLREKNIAKHAENVAAAAAAAAARAAVTARPKVHTITAAAAAIIARDAALGRGRGRGGGGAGASAGGRGRGRGGGEGLLSQETPRGFQQVGIPIGSSQSMPNRTTTSTSTTTKRERPMKEETMHRILVSNSWTGRGMICEWTEERQRGGIAVKRGGEIWEYKQLDSKDSSKVSDGTITDGGTAHGTTNSTAIAIASGSGRDGGGGGDGGGGSQVKLDIESNKSDRELLPGEALLPPKSDFAWEPSWWSNTNPHQPPLLLFDLKVSYPRGVAAAVQRGRDMQRNRCIARDLEMSTTDGSIATTHVDNKGSKGNLHANSEGKVHPKVRLVPSQAPGPQSLGISVIPLADWKGSTKDQCTAGTADGTGRSDNDNVVLAILSPSQEITVTEMGNKGDTIVGNSGESSAGTAAGAASTITPVLTVDSQSRQQEANAEQEEEIYLDSRGQLTQSPQERFAALAAGREPTTAGIEGPLGKSSSRGKYSIYPQFKVKERKFHAIMQFMWH